MSINPNIEIGKAITARRDKMKLSLTDLATKAKMTEKRLLQIELGKTNLHLGTLIQIAVALDMKTYELVKDLC